MTPGQHAELIKNSCAVYTNHDYRLANGETGPQRDAEPRTRWRLVLTQYSATCGMTLENRDSQQVVGPVYVDYCADQHEFNHRVADVCEALRDEQHAGQTAGMDALRDASWCQFG